MNVSYIGGKSPKTNPQDADKSQLHACHFLVFKTVLLSSLKPSIFSVSEAVKPAGNASARLFKGVPLLIVELEELSTIYVFFF